MGGEKRRAEEELRGVERERRKEDIEDSYLKSEDGVKILSGIDDTVGKIGYEKARTGQIGVMKAYRGKLRDEQLKNAEMLAKVQYEDSKEAIQNDLAITENMRRAEELRLNTKVQADYLKSVDEHKKMQRQKQILGERVSGYISADEQLEVARTVNDEIVKVEREKGEVIREIMGMIKMDP